MSHVATYVAAVPGVSLAAHHAPAVLEAEREAPPFWTPSRMDLARRLWAKGLDESAILVSLRRLPGPAELNGQTIAALAGRLCWPGPRQAARPALLMSRDGLPSMAERQAAELARTLDVVEMPLEDAVTWGRVNGVARQRDEADADLIARINRARAGYRLPRFRISRR